PSAYMASAKSMLTLDPDRSLSLWSQSLFRDSSTQNRLRAVQHLASSGKSQAMDSLILAIGAARRAPGRFAFFGKQVSLVTDFDVEVAQAASIADPVTNVITEGSVLEVRIISTRVSRAAMKGMHRLSGEDPGSTEEDWLRWWREKKIGD
ncbi:MAG: hypothetical protein QF524_07695, partial [Planctomycetota bacterium]|nr:hypothetical protein [Planctomycetota bacterium]